MEQTTVPLADLGDRIMILGPSNAGKSTLCHYLGKKLNIPSYHLDQMRHIDGTDWEERPYDIFMQMHNKAVAEEKWVIDGSYKKCMPKRIERATAIIWIDPPLLGCIFRYILRSIKSRKSKSRIGGIKNAKSEFSFHLIKYTLFEYPPKRSIYSELITNKKPNTIFIKINSVRELNKHYKFWQMLLP